MCADRRIWRFVAKVIQPRFKKHIEWKLNYIIYLFIYLFIHKLLTQTFLMINFSISLCQTVHSNQARSQVLSECNLLLKKSLRLFVVRDCTIHRTRTPYFLKTNTGLGESYVYRTVHYLTSWINWTNLLSLYEIFLLLNMFRMLLHSSSGTGDCM